MKDFQGKVAFITGGAGGIGLSMAKAFLKEGVQVAIADIRRDRLAKAEALLNNPVNVLTIELDVRDRTAFSWDEWLGIQRQLDRNKEMSPRNQKLHYLLRGLVFCKRDGLKYYGVPMHGKPYYRCSSHNRLLSSQHCGNRTVNAEWLDQRVWKEVEAILLNPQTLLAELKKRTELNVDTTHLEEQIKLNGSRFATLDEAETRYLRLYGIGAWSQDKLVQECERIRREKKKIEQEITELRRRIEEARELTLSIGGIKQTFQLAKSNLATLTHEEKRLGLESLSIKVFVDGESITIEGLVPMPESDIVSQPVYRLGHNINKRIPFVLALAR